MTVYEKGVHAYGVKFLRIGGSEMRENMEALAFAGRDASSSIGVRGWFQSHQKCEAPIPNSIITTKYKLRL